MLRQTGWATIGDRIEREVTTIYRGAARTMYETIVDRDDTSVDSGSPLASGHYSASTRIGLDSPNTSVAPIDSSYNYPSPEVHKYSVYNLPRPTIRATPSSVVTAWLRPFRLGQTIYISNASAYAVTIERGRRGKNGSWQKPRGVYLSSLNKLFHSQGWY